MSHRLIPFNRTELTGLPRVVEGRYCHPDCRFRAADYEETWCQFDEDSPRLEYESSLNGLGEGAYVRCRLCLERP